MIVIDLSRNIIKRYVEVATPEKVTSNSETVYGTVVSESEELFVMIDGSNMLTPVSSNIDIREGDRVLILVKNHEATVIGSPTSPTARLEELKKLEGDISEFRVVIADKVGTGELVAIIATIDELQADNVKINGKLSANEAAIEKLTVENATINGTLTAHEANIEKIIADKIDADDVEAKYATIESLKATDAKFDNLDTKYASVGNLEVEKARIDTLDAEKLSAEQADVQYAQIDFANIDEAAVEKLFSESGIIRDLVISEGKITGELVGVTIKGDIIEGGTVKADKLVVKGSDGLFYKLNTDGVTLTAEQTEYNSLSGTVITAKSITAEKIAVDDLVAFDATIGGFNITNSAIYSGVKSSVNSTMRGIYQDKDGQIAIGDANNFIKYYKDQNGDYKLEISAKSISLGSSGSSIEESFENIKNDVDSLRDEITTNLRIESSRGTVFKNDTVSTVLSVVIYHGTQRITDSSTMKNVFGNSAYIQWKWLRLDDESFGTILASDPRFGDNGFTFTLSPEDVDTKVTFMCELID